MEFERVLGFIKALNEERTEYVVFGAVALAAHGIVRATADLDLFVRPSEENVERLKRALRRTWNDPEIDDIAAADLAGEYPAIQYARPEVSIIPGNEGTPVAAIRIS